MNRTATESNTAASSANIDEDSTPAWPPMGEDAETPWLPTDPLPNPEPEVPGLDVPDPGIFEGVHTSAAALH